MKNLEQHLKRVIFWQKFTVLVGILSTIYCSLNTNGIFFLAFFIALFCPAVCISSVLKSHISLTQKCIEQEKIFRRARRAQNLFDLMLRTLKKHPKWQWNHPRLQRLWRRYQANNQLHLEILRTW